MDRKAACMRKTKETDISLALNIDGSGRTKIDTGIGFFDHMLDGFARHGLFDLEIKVTGDLGVDCHHTIEDTGIVLGRLSGRLWEIKRGSAATVIRSFPWMRRLPCVRWTCRAGHIFGMMQNLPLPGLAKWIRRWFVNFSMRSPATG